MTTATHAWELWSYDRYDGDRSFIEAFRDKGEAKRRAKTLRRHHPHVFYYLKHRRVPVRMQFGTRAHARGRDPARKYPNAGHARSR